MDKSNKSNKFYLEKFKLELKILICYLIFLKNTIDKKNIFNKKNNKTNNPTQYLSDKYLQMTNSTSCGYESDMNLLTKIQQENCSNDNKLCKNIIQELHKSILKEQHSTTSDENSSIEEKLEKLKSKLQKIVSIDEVDPAESIEPTTQQTDAPATESEVVDQAAQTAQANQATQAAQAAQAAQAKAMEDLTTINNQANIIKTELGSATAAGANATSAAAATPPATAQIAETALKKVKEAKISTDTYLNETKLKVDSLTSKLSDLESQFPNIDEIGIKVLLAGLYTRISNLNDEAIKAVADATAVYEKKKGEEEAAKLNMEQKVNSTNYSIAEIKTQKTFQDYITMQELNICDSNCRVSFNNLFEINKINPDPINSNISKFFNLLNNIHNNSPDFDNDIIDFLNFIHKTLMTVAELPATEAAATASGNKTVQLTKLKNNENNVNTIEHIIINFTKIISEDFFENDFNEYYKTHNRVKYINEKRENNQNYKIQIFKDSLKNIFSDFITKIKTNTIEISKYSFLNSILNGSTSGDSSPSYINITLYHLINHAKFDKVIQEIQEQIFKIPGIIVKMIDDFTYINKINEKTPSHIQTILNLNDKFIKVNDEEHCVTIGTDCNELLGVTSPGPINYGEFKAAYGPKMDQTDENIVLPQNEEIFDYLNNENGYNILGKIRAKKSVKLFGYGFSGSGKTFTLLEGDDDGNDPPLLHYIINNIKKNIRVQNEVVPTVKISVDLFYPHKDNDISDVTQFHAVENGLKDKVDTVVNNINTAITAYKPESGMTLNLKTKILEINNKLAQFAYILPTSNNPVSSRAFTIYNISIEDNEYIDNEKTSVMTNPVYIKSVQIIDLPGLEKRVDMIKDYFFPNKDPADILIEISDKTKKENLDQISTNIRSTLSQEYIGGHVWQNMTTQANSKTTPPVKEGPLRQDSFKLVFLTGTNIESNDNKILKFYFNGEIQEKSRNNFCYKILTQILLPGFNASYFGKVKLTNTTVLFIIQEYTKLMPKYIIPLINFLNYNCETYFKTNYLYEVSVNRFQEIVEAFTTEFIDGKKYKEDKGEEEVDLGNIIEKYKYIFKEIFNIDTTRSNVDSNGIPTNIDVIHFNSENKKDPIIISNYKSPVISCIAIIFKYIDMNKSLLTEDVNNQMLQNKASISYKIIFLTMLLKYITEQGGAIVTSLEHLLFEFLVQKKGGLADHAEEVKAKPEQQFIKSSTDSVPENYDKSNYSMAVTKYLQAFLETETAPIPLYKKGYNYQIDSLHAGMKENIYRKFLPGMNKILNIDGKSRFINILAILRKKEDATDIIKGCRAAKDTLEFGEVLTGVKACNEQKGGLKHSTKLIKSHNNLSNIHKLNFNNKKRLPKINKNFIKRSLKKRKGYNNKKSKKK